MSYTGNQCQEYEVISHELPAAYFNVWKANGKEAIISFAVIMIVTLSHLALPVEIDRSQRVFWSQFTLSYILNSHSVYIKGVYISIYKLGPRPRLW